MRTVFGLFQDFTAAEATVLTLQKEGFAADDINVIVLSQSAKTGIKNAAAKSVAAEKAQAEKPKARKGSRSRKPAAQGLKHLIGGERPVRIPEVGPVYAANELATSLAGVASSATPAAADGGLRYALEDAGLPPHQALAYHAGVQNGWLLLIVRTDDDRALKASSILTDHGGRDVFLFELAG